MSGGKTIARCPACAETGNDTGADHLFINGDGKFGCVLYQSTDGAEHRKRIFELVGISETKPTKQKGTFRALPSAPESAPFPSLKHYKHGMPVAHWIYRTNDGAMAGIVARFDFPDGRKDTLPMAWCRDENGETAWRWKSMPDPRTIYNLPLTEDFVVLVEGEKCAEAVKAAGIPATTWAGGSSALHKSDWSPLAGKTVVIWPDNDEPGRRALASLIHILTPIAGSVSVVTTPDGMPEGWDAADTTPEHIEALVAAASALDATVEPPSDFLDDVEPVSTIPDRLADMPFRMLGVADGIFRYLPDNGMTVVALGPSSHTSLNLIQLAPLQVWESVFPAKDGCKWSAAANAMIQMSQSLPQYDPRAIRGRGCWIDGDDVIYHAGDKISVNGSLMGIHAYSSPTRSIYEAGLPITLDTDNSSRNADSARVIELCESLSWDQPLFGKLLAGWMALAPISGAMTWRPHVWVTGASGSGKSWIMANIIAPLAGKTAVYVQGNTSEAGIRGRLRSDALPVMFDEAEAENQRSGMRMEGVIELARQASSEGGGGIIKGTQNGGSITYMVRSMFCFASIGVAAVKKADTSRIAILNLRKTDSAAQFETVKRIWRETVAKPEFCTRFRARSIRNAMVIRHNAGVFSSCAVEFTGDKRSADQIGTLLAGAYSLTSTKEISPKAATSWLAAQEWHSYKVDAIDSDENQCLAHLYAAPIRLEGKLGPETITIAETIDRARAEIVPGVEGLALMRCGLKLTDDGRGVYIANQHQGLERIFRDTPWSGAKWRGQLIRVAGAEVARNPVRFGPMILQRAVMVPLEM
jgi:putative DNA primase/helicase